jgi:hypothetical protein
MTPQEQTILSAKLAELVQIHEDFRVKIAESLEQFTDEFGRFAASIESGFESAKPELVEDRYYVESNSGPNGSHYIRDRISSSWLNCPAAFVGDSSFDFDAKSEAHALCDRLNATERGKAIKT